MSCYLLYVHRLPPQQGSSRRGWVIAFIWLELPWQYIAMTRNNLGIILISLICTTNFQMQSWMFTVASRKKYNKELEWTCVHTSLPMLWLVQQSRAALKLNVVVLMILKRNVTSFRVIVVGWHYQIFMISEKSKIFWKTPLAFKLDAAIRPALVKICI